MNHVKAKVKKQKAKGQLSVIARSPVGRRSNLTTAKIRGRVKRLPFGNDVDQYIDAVRGKATM